MVVYDAKGPCRGISICAATAGHRTHLATTAPVSLQRTRCSGTTKDGGMPNRSTTHRDVSPRERLQRGMQPSLTYAKPTRKHTLATSRAVKTAWESTATYGLRWSSPCHSPRTRTSRPWCDCFDFHLRPRSKRSRNATSTILRIYLCARTDCVSLGMGSQTDWMFSRRDIPRLLAALVTGRVFLPGRLPEGSVRRG